MQSKESQGEGGEKEKERALSLVGQPMVILIYDCTYVHTYIDANLSYLTVWMLF